MKKILYLAILIVAGTSCRSQKEIAIIDKDTQAITLKKGNFCEIKFITNASTGFCWKWTNKAEITVVDSVGNRYVSQAPAGMVGASSTRYWKFHAVQKGTQTLHFAYTRGNPDNAIKTRDIEITVR